MPNNKSQLETLQRQIERDFPQCEVTINQIDGANDFIALDHNSRVVATFSDAASYERFMTFLASCEKETAR